MSLVQWPSMIWACRVRVRLTDYVGSIGLGRQAKDPVVLHYRGVASKDRARSDDNKRGSSAGLRWIVCIRKQCVCPVTLHCRGVTSKDGVGSDDNKLGSSAALPGIRPGTPSLNPLRLTRGFGRLL